MGPDLTGQRFGGLVVVAAVGRNKHRAQVWLVRCDCGGTATVPTGSLRSGNSTRCGTCRGTHRMTGTTEWMIWQSMIQRCHNPKAKSFQGYGSRGIRVCVRWRESFENFLADVGRRPSPEHSLDRICGDGNYDPSNVRWAMPEQQARNKRNNHVLVVDGVRATLAEWAERTGIGVTTIRERLRRGWSASRAVTTPPKRSTVAGRASG